MADFAPMLAGVFVLLILSYLVYRDASNRGSEYATYWGIAMFFTNIIVPVGFLYYLYVRRSRECRHRSDPREADRGRPPDNHV